jgi:hypothetical protein
MSARASYSLEYVDPSTNEFKKVLGAAKIPYNPDAITPIILERVVNTRLQERFEKHVSFVCKNRNMTNAQAMLYPMYHGTTEAALQNILENGFDMSYNKTAAYGKGTYSATNYIDAMHYAKLDRTGHQFLLVCKVVKGNTKHGTYNEILDKTKYDSFTDGATYFSCPYNDGIIPVYVIRYYQQFPIEAKLQSIKPTKVIHRFR